MQRTKIVATIGPKTANSKLLSEMFNAGMSVARLNGSHNSLDWHRKTIRLIKKTLPDCPILLDIPGKKIRTAKLSIEPKFRKNDIIIVTTAKGYVGEEKVLITNNRLHNFIAKGDTVYADDGTLKFTVKKVHKNDIYLKAETQGILKRSKGINVPHVSLGGALVTSRDKKMIDFAIKQKVDFIGISFVESSKHVNLIKKLIKKESPKIVAKIENKKGIESLSEIIHATDVIMIDRGDLATETNIETLGINQKKIIQKAIELAKPVIVATEMLDNMINYPYPTKAEVLDISNSIVDGATATMLSGETAVGNYPVEAIKVMQRISSAMIKQKDSYDNLNNKTDTEGMANAIKNLCLSLPITKIIAITVSGFAARVISSQMLPQPIIAVSNNKGTARSFNILSGTTGVFFNTKFYKNSLDHIPMCLNYLWKNKIVSDKDMVLITALGYPGTGRRMNLLQTHTIKDLVKIFNWTKTNGVKYKKL
tara:strand:+ start:622 stop:2061 length:1440 start_codon:yes stop_codon:yes gene_type:complete